MGEDPLEQVVALVDAQRVVQQLDVDPPQQCGGDRVQRLVPVVHVEVEAAGVDAAGLGEPLPQQLRVGAARRHRHDPYAIGGHGAGPAVDDAGDVLGLVEPAGGLVLPGGVREQLPELLEGLHPPVLDVLLPLGGDLAHQVACGDHDLDGCRGERLDHDLRVLGGGAAEHLVADHDRARVRAGLLDERVPAARGARVRLTAPAGVGEIERRQECGIGHVAGDEHVPLAQQGAVAPQHVLQISGAGLRGPHVQDHARRPRGEGLFPAHRVERSQARPP